jgi:hypothetical protein
MRGWNYGDMLHNTIVRLSDQIQALRIMSTVTRNPVPLSLFSHRLQIATLTGMVSTVG